MKSLQMFSVIVGRFFTTNIKLLSLNEREVKRGFFLFFRSFFAHNLDIEF
jgi:hypothetical protein